MNLEPINNTCFFNTLYIQFVEDIGRNEYFYYDLKYPVIHNVKNGYFQVNENILNYLNNTIRSDVYTFKDGIFEEEQQINTENSNGSQKKENYQVYSDYAITFNKNQAISIILNLYAYEGNTSLKYNDLYSYNIDLLSGNQLLLKDIFRPGVNYLKLVSDFINYQISQNPDAFYPDTVVDIPKDQAFYLTDKGIVIYFALDEIAPQEAGIPKFVLEFTNFESYVNPRFYCNVKNMNFNRSRANRHQPPYRMYF